MKGLALLKKKKVSRKKPSTPRSLVKASLGRIFLFSRERRAAIKRAAGKCERCGDPVDVRGIKGPRPEVHHLDGLSWGAILDVVFDRLLCDVSRLLVVCKKCHDEAHAKDENKKVDRARP